MNFRMFEAQSLDSIRQLDVDAEIVGIELEAIVVRKARILANVHRQRGRRTVEAQLPVLVPIRVGFKRQRAEGRVSHGVAEIERLFKLLYYRSGLPADQKLRQLIVSS